MRNDAVLVKGVRAKFRERRFRRRGVTTFGCKVSKEGPSCKGMLSGDESCSKFHFVGNNECLKKEKEEIRNLGWMC